jgi:hypothetical protein
MNAHHDIVEVHPDNPHLAPHWRWLRASQLMRTGEPLSRRRDDRWILRAYRLQRDLKRAEHPAEFRRVLDEHGPVYWANFLYAHRDDRGRQMTPHALEAMLLTGQVTYSEIAGRLGTSAAVVESYAHIYFDVEHRLDQPDFIMFNVLGDAIHRGLAGRSYDLLWKLYGMFGGILVLSAIIRLCGTTTKPLDPSGVRAFFAQDVRDNMYRRAAIASKTVEISGFNILPFLEQFNRMVEIEKQGGEHSQDMIMAGVREMLLSLAPRARIGPPAPGEPGLLGRFDAGAAELTSQELIDLSLGRELAAGAEEAALLRFPDAQAPPAEHRAPE